MECRVEKRRRVYVMDVGPCRNKKQKMLPDIDPEDMR